MGDEYCLKPISETPHYLYLNTENKYYKEYVTEIDKGHSTTQYDALISSINSNKININNIVIPVSYHIDINKYVIIDGLHRTSIYLDNNINYIKCKLENNYQFNPKKRKN